MKKDEVKKVSRKSKMDSKQIVEAGFKVKKQLFNLFKRLLRNRAKSNLVTQKKVFIERFTLQSRLVLFTVCLISLSMTVVSVISLSKS